MVYGFVVYRKRFGMGEGIHEGCENMLKLVVSNLRVRLMSFHGGLKFERLYGIFI